MIKKRVDIAIVGAGLIGSALALWLAKNTQYSIAIIERNCSMDKPHEANQRVVALGHLAVNILQDVDIFDSLNAHQSHPYNLMRVWDENSNGELEFNSDKLEHDQLGYMVDSLACNFALQQQILEQSQQPKSNLECYFELDLKGLTHQHGRGILSAKNVDENDLEFSAQLVVAADGINSWVRQQSGIFSNRHSYQQRGVVARIETLEPHQNCAWQRFLSSGPVAILPLANNQSSIVWSADEHLADELMNLGSNEFEQRLEHALQGRLGSIKLLSKRADFPLSSQKVDEYFKRNIVLLGDAAHSIHPLAGQGANLGFKDIAALGQLLLEKEKLSSGKSKKPSNDIAIGEPQFLAHYQRKRQTDNRQTDALMSALNAAFKNDLPLLMAIRGLGMNVVNRSDILRSFFANQAMGL